MVLLPHAREDATIFGTAKGSVFIAIAAIFAFCPPPIEMTTSNFPSAYNCGSTKAAALLITSILAAFPNGSKSSHSIP